MFTFIVRNNDREIENLGEGLYSTHADAEAAMHAALDDRCPPGSPNRQGYSGEVVAVRFSVSLSALDWGFDIRLNDLRDATN